MLDTVSIVHHLIMEDRQLQGCFSRPVDRISRIQQSLSSNKVSLEFGCAGLDSGKCRQEGLNKVRSKPCPSFSVRIMPPPVAYNEQP